MIGVVLDSVAQVVDFQEVRFRSKADQFHSTLTPVAQLFARDLGVDVVDLGSLSLSSPEELSSGNIVVLDFLGLEKTLTPLGVSATWLPLVIFSGGKKVFSLSVAYNSRSEVTLQGITILTGLGEESTKCRTINSISKIGSSYIRTYLK